jgi:hypothetical protein
MLLALALLWPAKTIALLDGVPFDRPLETIALGLAIPAMAWLAPAFVDSIGARTLIVLILACKVAGAAVWTQEGLCAQFHLEAPLSGTIPKPSEGAAQSIPVEEPEGILRSWDARADWRHHDTSCSAIVARNYPSQSDFPAWFLNLTQHVDPPRGDLSVRVHGFLVANDPGTLRFATAQPLTGTVGDLRASSRGTESTFVLPAGTHPIDLTLPLHGDDWRLVGTWNDRDVWTTVLTTVGPPSLLDRTLWQGLRRLVIVLTLGLVLAWAAHTWRTLSPGVVLSTWTAIVSVVLVAMAERPSLERFVALPLLVAPFVPVPKHLQNARGLFLLVGVAWLAFFAARSIGQVGRFTLYQGGDDWLAYQVAGYRIFMGGYWLEGGNAVFNYQPLYRWMSGGLHMLFGDSSVGEVYWDAACLLMGALLSFRLVDERGGFRAGVAAAALTLATFTLGPIWYFVGRGLSEIAAAGWGFWAAFLLLRARSVGVGAAIGAGLCATLMFYTRLNHLPFMFLLGVLLLPAAAPASIRPAVEAVSALRRSRAAQAYGLVLVTGLMLFAWRTWHYTGAFSVFEGTSLAINDTGLRLSTLGSIAVWQRVAHSLSALVWMNEPPRPDPRAILLVAGVLLALLAVCQAPRVKTLPIGLCLATLGGTVGAFFAHTHNYPGRMSIHLVPLAVALVVSAVTPGRRLESS